MDQAAHNKIVSFIWSIADDVLRDLFVRGKYRDVILPMCVLRRLDAVLEPTKQKVLDTKNMLDQAGITEQGAALSAAAGQAFYNTSKFSLRDLKSRGNQQQLKADFEDFLDGFSQNVQDFEQEVTGTTIFNLSLASIRSLPILLPPLSDQLSIVSSIEKKLAPVHASISQAERQIALMREYRTRLSADIVTGQLDVRNAVQNLPPDAQDSTPETDDALDELHEDEGEIDESEMAE